jgi:hypothetical protein
MSGLTQGAARAAYRAKPRFCLKNLFAMDVTPFTSGRVPPAPSWAQATNVFSVAGRSAMPTAIKLVLTGLCVVVLSWPLLFWGKPALPEDGVMQRERALPSNVIGWHELLW